MYTYLATVSRVVDGDTVYVDVDLGFYLRQHMKLRLAGINTPEIRGAERAEGLNAKAFVAAAIPIGSRVVIKTSKLGKYGRYIADIYYLPDSADPHEILMNGRHLNQELLDAGLAELVTY
ncbi:MAG: thermonuclease family protein [Anaerolineales bacterium]